MILSKQELKRSKMSKNTAMSAYVKCLISNLDRRVDQDAVDSWVNGLELLAIRMDIQDTIRQCEHAILQCNAALSVRVQE